MISQANILIVDDEPGIQFFLKEALSRDGHHVWVAESGEAALEAITRQEFDLVLLDLQMRGIGGLAVLATLQEKVPDTVAIILTAHASIESAIEALRRGAHDYLFKPCRVEELRESVRQGLFKRQAELERRANSRFVADASHELRTPVSSIKLLLHLVEHGAPAKRAHYMELLHQEAERLDRLIENTLTLSRLQANKGQVNLIPVDLNAVVAEVVATQRARAERAGLELTFEPGEGLPTVLGEPHQINQIVTNLTANAIQYTPHGYVRLRTVRVEGSREVYLEVQDSGIGIAGEDLPRLFQRFYRGRRAAEASIPGTGLGLSIVKEIVDMHKGRIEVESQPGQGSTFRVWLPATPTV